MIVCWLVSLSSCCSTPDLIVEQRAQLTFCFSFHQLTICFSFHQQLNNEFVPLEIILLAKVADVDGVIRMLDAFKTNDGNFLIIMQRPEQVLTFEPG